MSRLATTVRTTPAAEALRTPDAEPAVRLDVTVRLAPLALPFVPPADV
jgi:hypothetical protein